MALMTALAGLGGYASNTEAARTGTSSTSGTNSNTTRRVLTPGQTTLNDTLTSTALQRITNPSAVAEPLRAATREKVNASFAGAPDMLRKKYGATGYGSGKMGTAQRQTEISRLGALSGVDSDFNNLILQLQEGGIGLGERLLSQNFGTESSGGYSQNGKVVNPGSALGGTLINSSNVFSQQVGILARLLGIDETLGG